MIDKQMQRHSDRERTTSSQTETATVIVTEKLRASVKQSRTKDTVRGNIIQIDTEKTDGEELR